MSSLAYLSGIPIEKVQGLGGRKGEILRKAGITSVADLLLHVPRRYVDRSKMVSLDEAQPGEELTIVGTVTGVSQRRPRRGLVLVEARISDGDRTLTAVWFNQTYRLKQLTDAGEVALSGKLDVFRGKLQMTNPAVDLLSTPGESLVTGRVVPVHPAVGNLAPGHMRRALHNALRRSQPVSDPWPLAVLAKNDLIDREKALNDIHFPVQLEDTAEARRRLVFDELFRLELGLALQKQRQMEEARGFGHVVEGELVDSFRTGLPYVLTGAQERVLAEIRRDLSGEYPMHRLLQGEVGSGKTVVAVLALLMAVQGGYQGAIMAPTEVLAEQHFSNVAALLGEAGLAPVGEEGSLFAAPEQAKVRLALLTSSQVVANHRPSIRREQLIEDIANGDVDIVVGTHALIQEGVHFKRLGVAVVDEQHRFGVGQRVLLREKGVDADPDVLIMTATPIPRTLSMTLYGDLDVSVLDEMPPGRTPVATRLVPPSRENQAWEVVRREAGEGRQAFVVCPLVQDSPKIEAASAEAEYQRLREVLTGLRLGLIHGQLPSKEKEAAMASFRDGEVDVLVATTVIEVGIDVPNATVMVVEDADRFGLSQLHQLRGRVGRGTHPGICLLISDPTTEEAERRLAAMVSTTDGFLLAEEDLRIRGQGTVFGARQSGLADLKLADILSDFETLVAARREAFNLVAADPGLKSHPEVAEEVRAFLGEEVEWLFKS